MKTPYFPILDVFDAYVKLVSPTHLVAGSSLPKLYSLRMGVPLMTPEGIVLTDQSLSTDPIYKVMKHNFLMTSVKAIVTTYVTMAASFVIGVISAQPEGLLISTDLAERLLDATVKSDHLSIDDKLTNMAAAFDAEVYLRRSQTNVVVPQAGASALIIKVIEFVGSYKSIATLGSLISLLRILTAIGRISRGYYVERFTNHTANPNFKSLKMTDGTLACIPMPTQPQLAFYAEPDATYLSENACCYLQAIADFYADTARQDVYD